MSKKEEKKPCPWCEGLNWVVVYLRPDHKSCHVVCRCGLETRWYSREDSLMRAFNKRSDIAAMGRKMFKEASCRECKYEFLDASCTECVECTEEYSRWSPDL